MFTRRLVLVLAATGVLVGCPKKETSSDDDGETKKDDDDKDKPEPAPAKVDNDALAFALGRKYAFACVFSLLDKADAAAKNIGSTTTSAKALGITPPTAPSKEGAMEAMRSSTLRDEIEKKHGAKAGAAYSLGITATDMFFGVALGSPISDQLTDSEKHARAAGIPEDAWKSKLDAAKATATEDTIGALNGVFDAHFKYAE